MGNRFWYFLKIYTISNLLWTFTKLKKLNFTKNMDKLTISGFNIYELRRGGIVFKTSMYPLTKQLKSEKISRKEKAATLVYKKYKLIFLNFCLLWYHYEYGISKFCFLSVKNKRKYDFLRYSITFRYHVIQFRKIRPLV